LGLLAPRAFRMVAILLIFTLSFVISVPKKGIFTLL